MKKFKKHHKSIVDYKEARVIASLRQDNPNMDKDGIVMSRSYDYIDCMYELKNMLESIHDKHPDIKVFDNKEVHSLIKHIKDYENI